jgi:hypothetical protein
MFKHDYLKGEKSTLKIFFDINSVGKLSLAFSRFRVMQVVVTHTDKDKAASRFHINEAVLVLIK